MKSPQRESRRSPGSNANRLTNQEVPICQYRLGRLLLDSANRPERDYVQAVAWFQLAGERGIQEARDIASREAAKLTPAQTVWMTTLKAQLARK
jgi:hypothetical protein